MNNMKHILEPLLGNPKTGTLANSEDPDEMPHDAPFTRVCTVCFDKIDLQRKKYDICFNYNL